MAVSERFVLFLNFLFYDSPIRLIKALKARSSEDDFCSGFDAFVAQSAVSVSFKKVLLERMGRWNYDKLRLELDKHQIKVLLKGDAAYPVQLSEIYDPPELLFYIGELDLLKKPSLAVVGPRKVTEYGVEVTRVLTAALLPHFQIVSGMALGVDRVAHKCAISNGFSTLAVIGCGLNVLYPTGNADLFEELKRGGLVLSEYPPSVRPLAMHFPQRNRLVSGIASGVLITEAGVKSGALNTARHALEQGREVFAVPGSIFF